MKAATSSEGWIGECRLCNNIIDLVPDNVVGLVVEGCSEEGYDASYIEIPGC